VVCFHISLLSFSPTLHRKAHGDIVSCDIQFNRQINVQFVAVGYTELKCDTRLNRTLKLGNETSDALYLSEPRGIQT
jgi:hypothetical protein